MPDIKIKDADGVYRTYTGVSEVEFDTTTPGGTALFGYGASGTPIELSTTAEMYANLIDESVGKFYKFTGADGAGLRQNEVYHIEKDGYSILFREVSSNKEVGYFCITAVDDNVVINMNAVQVSPTFETSKDAVNWSSFIPGETTVTLQNAGDKLFIRGENDSVCASNFVYTNIIVNGRFSASGNVFSLVYSNALSYEQRGISKNFNRLMNNNAGLLRFPPLYAKIPTGNDYYYMFSGCTGLVAAPEIFLDFCTPIATGWDSNFNHMFSGCTSLKYPSKMHMKALGLERTCESMYYNCTSLEQLPALYICKLEEKCYSSMFSGCQSIKISTTKDAEYKNTFRIPYSGTTGVMTGSGLGSMFTNTGGTFTGTPSLNTTYYTANEVV